MRRIHLVLLVPLGLLGAAGACSSDGPEQTRDFESSHDGGVADGGVADGGLFFLDACSTEHCDTQIVAQIPRQEEGDAGVGSPDAGTGSADAGMPGPPDAGGGTWDAGMMFSGAGDDVMEALAISAALQPAGKECLDNGAQLAPQSEPLATTLVDGTPVWEVTFDCECGGAP